MICSICLRTPGRRATLAVINNDRLLLKTQRPSQLLPTSSRTSRVGERNISTSILRGGGRIASEVLEASSNNTSLEPIFIAHGMMGSGANFASIAKQLHKKTGRKIVTYDARNHGTSFHCDTMSYPEMSSDLIGLIREHHHPEGSVNSGGGVILMGHSMGGRTVMYTALAHPHIVKKLIVVDVSPCNVDFSTMDATSWNMAHFFHAMRSVKFLQPSESAAADSKGQKWSISRARQDADRQLSLRIHDAGIRQWLLMNMVQHPDTKEVGWRHNLDAIQTAFESDIRTFPAMEADITYDGPTLFVGGSESEYIPVSDHPEILERFPSADFQYIEGAGHWVHAQKPSEFLDIVLDNLK